MVKHKSENKIQQEIAAAKQQITIGGTYQHYKGTQLLYKVIALATLEATDELCVVYQALYGDNLKFVRPVSVWLDSVEWAGKTVLRFKPIKNHIEI